MKSKKRILTALCIILLVAVLAAVCLVLRAAPTVNHALQISALLQPVLNAGNQTMHIAVSAAFEENSLNLESDVYLVTEDDRSYLAIEQNGIAIYIADNVLFLENGKAFKIGQTLQVQTRSRQELLPHIAALYDALKITAKETENEITYTITVTGAQIETLLAAASLGETMPVASIEKLTLELTEQNGTLEQIVFSGSSNAGETPVSLQVTLSGFRILASGEYPVPEAVKQSADTVNPDALFSLSEDLYRLILALAPLADMESLDGTLALTVDCGLLQLDTKIDLSDLQTGTGSQLDPENLQALPEIVGFLCMEGDISCTAKDTAYVYTLALDQHGIQELSRMLFPELAQYSGNLTNGDLTITLEDSTIVSIELCIGGKLHALIAQIPIAVRAEFTFR